MAIEQAQAALTNAEAAVSSAMTDDAKLAAYLEVQRAADNLVTALTTHGGSPAEIAAAASKSGNAEVMADNLQKMIAADRMAADAAMIATAAKLYAGISAPFSSPDSSGAGVRAAGYTAAGVFRVNAGLPANASAPVTLSQDKEAMVAAHRGWEGMKFTASPTGAGTYEAVVYSNVGAPTPGEKFSVQYTGNFANGVLNETITEAGGTNIASPSFDQTAGVKEFELGSNNVAVMIPGSFHGVAGTYSCDPGDNNTCAVQVAANGFNLGGTVDASNAFDVANAVWTFKPGNPDARVTEMPDTSYVSYGWWIYKSADGNEFRASAFRDEKGTVLNARDLNALNGTATYVGGAAGKYALSSPIGGTNDAGHFTATATLEANFTTNAATNAVTGTIDNFIGADGEARDWSVELKGSPIQTGGQMTGATRNGTAWTIGGTAAAASGEWVGQLYDNGDDGVPKVAAGTFYSTYGPDGKLVGAFGANLEE